MEKKILHTFRLTNSLFCEARFVYKKPGKAPDAEAEEADPGEEDAEKETDLEGKKDDVIVNAASKKAKLKEGVKGRGKREKFKKDEKLPDGASAEKEPVKLPTAPSLDLEEFKKKDLAEQTNQLDWFRINGTRENSKMNAQTWDHSTEDGLRKIYQDFKDLGILGKDAKDRAYYDTMFAVLNGAVNSGNPYLAENKGDFRPMFKSPTDGTSRETIAGLQPKGTFKGGEVYLKAFDALTLVRGRLMVQDKKQVDTLNAQKKKGEDVIGTTVVDFAKSNISVLQKAAKERDYATLGVYAVGAYALWQTLGKKLFGGDDHGGGDHGAHGGGVDFKKWLMYGAAIYGADKMLKNAGYDVLKMAGFKGMDAEVDGTPLKSMKNILATPEHNEQYKDLDYGIALTMSETKLTDLQSLMLNANKSGIHFIHPREFPALFPEMATVWPFKMGIGEQGLKDYVGMNNTKLSAAEREYIRVGQQLYKLSMAMPLVYEKTLYKDHEKYKGLPYEKMLQDPVRGTLKVRHLLEAASQYAPEGIAGGMFSGKKPQEIEEKLRNGTKEVLGENGFTLDTATELKEGSGHIAGMLKGFPIVVVATKEGYRVYLQNDYGDKKGYNSVPGATFTLIPLEGAGMERAAKEAAGKVDARMAVLMKKLKDKNKTISGLKYVGGQWKATTAFNGAPDLGVNPTNVETLIKIVDDGKTLRLDDGESSSEKYLERSVIGKLLSQPDFQALNLFGPNRLGIIKDLDKNDGIFTLLIGKNKQVKTEIIYKGGGFKFKDANGEADLLKMGSGFGVELKDALSDNERLKSSVDKLKALIDNADESYLRHFFKNLPGWFTGVTWANVAKGVQLKDLTGSVAKNYTKGLIDAQMSLVLVKIGGAADGSKKLSDVSGAYGSIFVPAIDRLDKISDRFSAESTKKEQVGDDWSEGDFNDTVFNEIAGIGIQNSDYKYWYSQFVQEIFAGKYGMDDLRKGNSIKSRDIIKVFSYYTAIVDKDKISGANLGPDPTNVELTYIGKMQEVKDLYGSGTIVAPNVVLAEINKRLPSGVVPLTLPELSRLKKVKDAYSLKQNHIKAAKYVEYVAGQIYRKYNDGSLASMSAIPSPESGTFWNIESFDTFNINNKTYSHEFIDTRELVKTSSSYTTLDKYLGMDAAGRAGVNKNMVILPRYNHDFSFPLDASGSPADKDGWALASGLLTDRDPAGKINNMKKTETEELFESKFKKLRRKLEEDFKGELVIPQIAELEDRYTVSGTAEMDSTVPDKLTFKYTFDQVIDDTGRPIDKDITEDVKRMEKMSIDKDTTVTRGKQLAHINDRLEEIFTHQVRSSEGKAIYVDRDTLPEKFKRFFKDIKLWLFDDV